MADNKRQDSYEGLQMQEHVLAVLTKPQTVQRGLTQGGVSKRFEPSVDAPREARHLVARILGSWGADRRLIEDAQLVVSELTTNAVVHGGTDLAVHVEPIPGGVKLAVEDGGPGVPHQTDAPVTASAGRGLAIVDEIADRWGFSGDSDGKLVWAELHQPDGEDSRVIALRSPREFRQRSVHQTDRSGGIGRLR